MKPFRYIRNGESLLLDEKACVGCGLCVEVCPHAVFDLGFGTGRNGAGRRVARILDRGLCMECGACARNCPARAISVKAGVGCAAAIMIGKLRGTAPDCGSCCGSGDASVSPDRSASPGAEAALTPDFSSSCTSGTSGHGKRTKSRCC